VRRLLNEGKPQEAMETVSSHARSGSKALINAYGVCLMRTGRYREAVNILRGLVYQGDTFAMAEDTPAVVKTNYATALLLNDNVDGCEAILNQLKGEETPTSARLTAAITRWKQDLSFFQRVQRIWGTPSLKVSLDFPPGDV